MPASSSAIRAGSAFIEIFAEDSKLQRKLAGVQAKMRAWSATASAAGLKVMKGAGAVLGGFGTAVRMFTNIGSELVHASLRTGDTVESLSMLRYIAEQTGTGVEGLEKAIKLLDKQLTLAAEGSDEVATMFARVGLNAKALALGDDTEKLIALSAAFLRVGNATYRAGLAQQIFGRSGIDMLPLLLQGPAALRKMAEEAKEFGLIVSTKDATAAEDLRRKLGLLWATVKMGAFHVG